MKSFRVELLKLALKGRWVFKEVNEQEGIKSTRVLQLNTSSNNDSPKKKKKHQKLKRITTVGRAVTVVYWNLQRKLLTALEALLAFRNAQKEFVKIESQANEYAAKVPFLVPNATVKTNINI